MKQKKTPNAERRTSNVEGRAKPGTLVLYGEDKEKAVVNYKRGTITFKKLKHPRKFKLTFSAPS